MEVPGGLERESGGGGQQPGQARLGGGDFDGQLALAGLGAQAVEGVWEHRVALGEGLAFSDSDWQKDPRLVGVLVARRCLPDATAALEAEGQQKNR